MDKIPELVNNYGTIGLILAIIAITDIPKSFFSALIKWSFEKKEKTYWPPKPTRSAFILPVMGFISYQKTKFLRQEFLKELIKEKKSKISQLFGEITNAQVSYKQFKSRGNFDLFKEINIINGIPGVGKSSFILNYLEETNSKNKIDFVFYFNNYSIYKAYPNLKNRQEDINGEQVWQELGKYNLDYTKLSPTLLSYLLNYRYVYFIIDGIDKEEDIETTLANLNRYINKFHINNKKLKVLISSRVKTIQQPFVNFVNLLPLETQELQDYFYTKSEELHLSLHQNPIFGQLVDSEFSILKFDNKVTRTPLFVEVVLIILREKGLANLAEEFHHSIASIYKLFIKVLYERSPMGSRDYDKFYVLYRNLAYKTWETGNNIDIEEINENFKNSPFDIQFLIENGLLVQYDTIQNVYSFIHQTIPDVLAIEALSLKNDFSHFEKKQSIREDIHIYLKDEIKSITTYTNLLITNPTIAAALFDRPFFNKISRNDFNPSTRMIIKTCLDYIILNQNIKSVDSESLVKILIKLSEWQSQMYDILLDEVKTLPNSKNLLEILLALQTDQIKTYILNLINSNISRDILGTLLDNNQNLRNIIDPYFDIAFNNENYRTLRLFALQADINNQKHSYKRRYIKNISIRSNEEIKFFLSRADIRNEVFFKEYIHKELNTTNRLNNLLQTIGFKEIFLPRGTYSIGNENITNNKSITFSKSPFKKELKENNLNSAILTFQNQVNYKLWTFDQFKIAYAYFEGTINNSFNGFLGLHGFSDVRYEAVKENNINRVAFAYFESNSSNSNICLSNNSTERFDQLVLWRPIQDY